MISYIQHCTEKNENPRAYDIVRDLLPRAACRGFVEAIFEHGAIPEPRPSYHAPINPRDLEPPFPSIELGPVGARRQYGRGRLISASCFG